MNKLIKALFITFFIISTILFIQAQNVIDTIVAIVNNDIITLSDYRIRYNQKLQAVKAEFPDGNYLENFERIIPTILEEMITEILLIQEAENQGIEVDDRIIANIEEVKKEYNLNSDAELIRALEQQGISFEDYKNSTKKRLQQQYIIQKEVYSTIAIDDSDYVDYYKKNSEDFLLPAEYKIRAIFLLSENYNSESLEEKKREINDKITAGTDMSTVAEEFSEGPEKESKGDLGWFTSGKLIKELEDGVKDLKVGALSSWISSGQGWFKLKLEEKKESRLKPFEESKEEIKNILYEQLAMKKTQEYLIKLKKTSFIKIHIPQPEKRI